MRTKKYREGEEEKEKREETGNKRTDHRGEEKRKEEAKGRGRGRKRKKVHPTGSLRLNESWIPKWTKTESNREMRGEESRRGKVGGVEICRQVPVCFCAWSS